jgi:hypothetical protein
MARMVQLRREAANVPGKGETRTTEFYEKASWKILLGRLRRR